jgi:hypothetical protein
MDMNSKKDGGRPLRPLAIDAAPTPEDLDPRILGQLAERFDALSGGFTREAEHKLELARAMGDGEAVKREHIKIQVMRAARKMFAGSFREATGQRGLEAP